MSKNSDLIEIPGAREARGETMFLNLGKDPQDFRLVFVYGTLLEGMPNYGENLGLKIAEVQSIEDNKFSMVLTGPQALPAIIKNAPEHIQRNVVYGDLYLVDGRGAARMDWLEGSNDTNIFYEKTAIEIALSNLDFEGGINVLPGAQRDRVIEFINTVDTSDPDHKIELGPFKFEKGYIKRTGVSVYHLDYDIAIGKNLKYPMADQDFPERLGVWKKGLERYMLEHAGLYQTSDQVKSIKDKLHGRPLPNDDQQIGPSLDALKESDGGRSSREDGLDQRNAPFPNGSEPGRSQSPEIPRNP